MDSKSRDGYPAYFVSFTSFFTSKKQTPQNSCWTFVLRHIVTRAYAYGAFLPPTSIESACLEVHDGFPQWHPGMISWYFEAADFLRPLELLTSRLFCLHFLKRVPWCYHFENRWKLLIRLFSMAAVLLTSQLGIFFPPWTHGCACPSTQWLRTGGPRLETASQAMSYLFCLLFTPSPPPNLTLLISPSTTSFFVTLKL